MAQQTKKKRRMKKEREPQGDEEEGRQANLTQEAEPDEDSLEDEDQGVEKREKHAGEAEPDQIQINEEDED